MPVNSYSSCVYVFVRLPGCLQAVRAIAWLPPWRWVAPHTIAALPATCLVPVTPPEALLTGDRSPCLNSKEEGERDCVCLLLYTGKVGLKLDSSDSCNSK